MADQDIAVKSDQEQRDMAKRDAKILAEAAVIRQNAERFEAAKVVAVEMALEIKDQFTALANVAASSIEYPKMERERAESTAAAPSPGV